MSGSRNSVNEDETVVLEMLNQIERDSGVTQRHLAQELGIALGLTNAYLKRCVKKGYVKIRQVPLNRYAYYVTPRGFAEKSRLTSEYLRSSLDFFRRARRDCVLVLTAAGARGWQNVALWGTGDLTEIAVLSAVEAEVTIVGIIDPAQVQKRCAGHSVVGDLAQAALLAGPRGVQAILVTDGSAPHESLQAAQAAAANHGLTPDRVMVLELLAVRPANGATKPAGGKAAR